MLEKMLEKSEHYRQKVAYIATLVIGVLIFSVWLVIANFNVRQAFNPYNKEETKMANKFEKKLPSLRQSESVTTELAKKQGKTMEEKATDETKNIEEKKPFWKFW